eukprot:1156004-Pelagomonas_calceolata.AAC.4
MMLQTSEEPRSLYQACRVALPPGTELQDKQQCTIAHTIHKAHIRPCLIALTDIMAHGGQPSWSMVQHTCAHVAHHQQHHMHHGTLTWPTPPRHFHHKMRLQKYRIPLQNVRWTALLPG